MAGVITIKGDGHYMCESRDDLWNYLEGLLSTGRICKMSLVPIKKDDEVLYDDYGYLYVDYDNKVIGHNFWFVDDARTMGLYEWAKRKGWWVSYMIDVGASEQ